MTPDKYTVTKVDETHFKLDFAFPNELGLAGQNKEIILVDGTTEHKLKVNIQSDPPNMNMMSIKSPETLTATSVYFIMIVTIPKK